MKTHLVYSLFLLTFLALCGSRLGSAAELKVKITPDVVYGHKDGLALTFDVFTPTENANGAGVLFIVSGGWYSNWSPPEKLQGMFTALTSKGFTVFAVRHGSSPRYGIPDAVADVRRSVRFIRKNAEQFGVDPNRLGVFGISAGGHLSLTLGTTGDDGLASDADPLNKTSDRVQAVVAFVAPTDLTVAVKGAKDRLPAYGRFPALNLDVSQAKVYSPLFHVSADDAPTLLLAGVKDDLVPIFHNRNIHAAFDEKQVVNKLVEYPEAGHGFPPADMQQAMTELVGWFEKHLLK
ncbi:MAG: alpha/beta hydrolase [Planctomyces sp.]|nr:alpha/beta hydrolase [Planctomyces sp.]